MNVIHSLMIYEGWMGMIIPELMWLTCLVQQDSVLAMLAGCTMAGNPAIAKYQTEKNSHHISLPYRTRAKSETCWTLLKPIANLSEKSKKP